MKVNCGHGQYTETKCTGEICNIKVKDSLSGMSLMY